MRRFIARRLIQAVAIIFGVSLVTFGLLHATGDPVALLLPLDATQAEPDRLRTQLGLDDPLVVQYWRFVSGAVRGDFGRSIRQSEPALGLVLERLPATLELTLTAMGIAVAVAIPAGILAAAKRGTVVDQAAMLIALVGQSMPNFWLGIMLLLLFSVQLEWLPPFGRGGWQGLVLPAVTLAMYSMARTARLVRSGLIDVLGQDYIRTARAKGLKETLVLRRHALRNGLLPVVTVLGLDLAHLLGGAVITETIFAWPGIGRLAVSSIGARDYPVVQAVVFLVAVAYTVMNFFVDVLYAYLNPRVRFT
ncbi:MAG: ABC transporter permease [Chloroflexota bacterium]|nr:ABC transporter permease [Chloroflexota bacterium]